MPDYVVKDSGERQEYSTGMRRDTMEGKPRFDLVVPANLPFDDQFLTRLAMLMTRGADKYGERNWERARTPEELRRFRSSAYRHFMQWFTSVDDGEDHAVAAAFNLIAAEYCWYHLTHPGELHPADTPLPEQEEEIGPRAGDVFWHHHNDARSSYYLPEGSEPGAYSVHEDMKPHRHLDDGRVLPK